MDGMTHKFLGTKLVLAVAMILSDYNKYRGWKPPEGEDQSVEGYLVEYTDGGKPNHEDHKGYISWSPKDVFERSYRAVDTPKQRVELELFELSDKTTKLETFISSSRFESVASDQRALLLDQRIYMRNYMNVLNARLNSWRD